MPSLMLGMEMGVKSLSELSSQPAHPSTLLAYLRLFRLPNVFTAAADVMMGYLFVHSSLAPNAVFASLVATSCLLYVAGMVLNDVYDFEVDLEQRPSRPLPSGKISLGWARWLGYELLLVGVALGWLAGFIFTGLSEYPWRSGVVATLLAIAVVLYDATLKKTALAPLAMGACRFLNVLLGMSLAGAAEATGPLGMLGFDGAQLAVAGGIGLYIVGVTWFARQEAAESSKFDLAASSAVMMLGIALLCVFPYLGRFAGELDNIKLPYWFLLMAALGASILRRCLVAVFDPVPAKVQVAVKSCIVSLIVLDAAVCMAASGPIWAIAVLMLLMPMLGLGKWVYST